MKSIDTTAGVGRMLSPCDIAHLGFHRTMAFHYRVSPDYNAMREALSRLENQLPDIAGRIRKGNDGEFYIAPCRQPLELCLEETSDVLPDYSSTYLRTESDINQDMQAILNDPKDLGGPLIRLRLVRYACGGAILSMRLAHSLADGQGRGMLLRQWAMLSRGLSPQTSLDPDRHAAMALALDDVDTEEDADTIVMTRTELARLLKRTSDEPTNYIVVPVLERAISTLAREPANGGTLPLITRSDLLTAKLWQVVANLQPDNAQGRLSMPLDIRCRPELGIGERYLGNALSFGYVDYEVSEIRSATISNLAAKLRSSIMDAVTRRAVSRLYRRYWKYRRLREDDSFAIKRGDLQAMLRETLFINNFSRFPVRELDFGTGAPHQVCGIRQPSIPSACIFPAPSDGYVVHLHLFQSQVPTFSRIVETDPFFNFPRSKTS